MSTLKGLTIICGENDADNRVASSHLLSKDSTVLQGRIYHPHNQTTLFLNDAAEILDLPKYVTSSPFFNEYFYGIALFTGTVVKIYNPETNIHPAEQRRLTRFLVALVNNGVKVCITTHSDYIIIELNNLIMFSQDEPHIKALIKRFADKGYTERDKLSHEKVAAYIVKPKSQTFITRIRVSKQYGMTISSFDDTITEMNNIRRDIHYGG